MTFHFQLKIPRLLLGVLCVQLLYGFLNANNNDSNYADSLLSHLTTIEKQSMEIRKTILDVNINDIEMLIHLYDLNKRSNAMMNQLLTQTLGNIGDKKVIPLLMEIAQNTDLPVSVRNSSVEILSKKQAPELVDIIIEMLGNPSSRDRVSEFALNVMGDLSEERMIMALLESYQLGKNKYFSLLNTVMNGLSNFENPKIKSVYKEIIKAQDFPSKIRVKAFKGLIRFSKDPEAIDEVIKLLNDPDNYIYYQEIVKALKDFGIYDDYNIKLRMSAFKAMKRDSAPYGIENE